MLLPMLKETNERDLCVTFVLIQKSENSPRKEGAKGRREKRREGQRVGERSMMSEKMGLESNPQGPTDSPRLLVG